jgi:GntR family transcriptional regulator, transcriptional repressor for pyruvate dehydrogenase complex
MVLARHQVTNLTEKSALIKPLEREQRLYERVAERILDLIKNDTWKTGDRLPTERELAEAFEVSRTVIREAVKVLEAQGWLQVTSGSGIYVRRPDSELVSRSLETYVHLLDSSDATARLAEVRRILEVEIATLAAERANAEQRERLRGLCEELRSATSTAQFAELDFQFHMLLAEATQNEFFGVLLAPLIGQLQDLFHFVWKGYEGRSAEPIFQHHEAIVTAVEQQNGPAARTAMEEHMAFSAQNLQELLGGKDLGDVQIVSQ